MNVFVMSTTKPKPVNAPPIRVIVQLNVIAPRSAQFPVILEDGIGPGRIARSV